MRQNPNLEIYNLAGGIDAWAAAGLPVRTAGFVLPLDRQVQLTIGIVLVVASGLALLVALEQVKRKRANRMRPNIGSMDRIARFVLGLVLLAFALQLGFPATGWNWVGWIGVVPILTAVIRYCPAYSLVGIRTGR